ncbi:MAG: M28 family peptidase [Trueperaceae bacterium]|nr:M28 family peptidase [Trueperaceae bacterium]
MTHPAAHRLPYDVERLALPDGRAVGTAGHASAQAYLIARLAELDLEPYGDAFALPYAAGDRRFANLVGVAPGLDRGAAPVLIAAHHDTVPGTPGADDNAAAVAIALEVGARLRARPAARGVLIALFDAEEPPYFHTSRMGSTYWHAHQRRGPVHAAVVLDLVGHAVPIPGLEDLLAVTGMESDPGLENVVSRTAGALPADHALQLVTALNRYVGDLSDHHVFCMNEVPYLFLSCGRWTHYHAPTDVPDVLDYPKMARVADVTEALVRGAAERDMTGPWEGYDTMTTDVATMNAALEPLLARYGLEVRDRAGIERVVRLLAGSLGL